MKRTRIGDRLIVIGPTTPAAEQTGCAPSTRRRAKARRIVVIKDGERVGGVRGR